MLNINNLSFRYGKNAFLFEGINLELEGGHIYGLLGKNGAGKSTLLKNMTGLAFPTMGECLFNGIDVSGRSVRILEDLFFIAEDFFLPSVTPIRFATDTAPFYPGFDHKDFYDYLDVLDVDRKGVMNKQSFGQQKKALIAFGLATHTSFLAMDEPTNGLDIPSKVQFRKLIASIQSESRCIIISTHQVRDLDSLIDTLIVLHDREIIVNNSLDSLVEKLIFGTYVDTSGLPVLYEEETIRGKNAILKNKTGQFSKVDSELLFSALTSGNNHVSEFLNTPGK